MVHESTSLTFVYVWLLGVQLLSRGLIRVRLDAERLMNAQHLEEERNVSFIRIELMGDFRSDEMRVCGKVFFQGDV